MLKDKNIICISSIDWDFIWQGHQEIMSVLSRQGNRVLFIENTGVRVPGIKDAGRIWHRFLNWKKGFKGIRKIEENLYVYSPLVLPFPYSTIAVRINKILMLSVLRRWMKIMEFHDSVVWTFLPTPLVQTMLDELDPSIFIYYCIDDFVSSSTGASRIEKIEKDVIKSSDLVFTTSHKLYDRCLAINKETHLFPFGINVSNYNKARENSLEIPGDLRNIERPIIGYVGGLHKWIDIDLLKKIVSARKDISFVLIGPKQTDLHGLDRFDNVFILGQKEPHELPLYVKYFDAGIIPYKIAKYTDNVYPTKINEYLAMGKSVISTAIPEVLEFDRENGGNFIQFIKSPDDIDTAIKKALSGNNSEMIAKRVSVANSNAWIIKIEKMCELIDKKICEIQVRINNDWLERFKRFYNRARRKTIKLIGAVLVAYMILFYSPLIWLVASPLRISEKPQKADAIVVFGGGVGESGSPGKSTIERTRFSVELYKKGWAKYIIYSSGYIYKYNDVDNMKLFAISMDVPEEDIILEREANSTYENVKYSNAILTKRGFNTIILVTSPYNMRRASLVFRNIAKNIHVIYVPVPDPQFYYRKIPVGMEQLQAIMHEYLGIIYYFIKGYV